MFAVKCFFEKMCFQMSADCFCESTSQGKDFRNGAVTETAPSTNLLRVCTVVAALVVTDRNDFRLTFCGCL